MRINFMRHKPLPFFVVRSWRMKFYFSFLSLSPSK